MACWRFPARGARRRRWVSLHAKVVRCLEAMTLLQRQVETPRGEEKDQGKVGEFLHASHPGHFPGPNPRIPTRPQNAGPRRRGPASVSRRSRQVRVRSGGPGPAAGRRRASWSRAAGHRGAARHRSRRWAHAPCRRRSAPTSPPPHLTGQTPIPITTRGAHIALNRCDPALSTQPLSRRNSTWGGRGSTAALRGVTPRAWARPACSRRRAPNACGAARAGPPPRWRGDAARP